MTKDENKAKTNEKGKVKGISQTSRIKAYISEHGGITQYEALIDLGILRLASRICELRQAGEKISDRWREVKNRYGEICRIKEYYYEVASND